MDEKDSLLKSITNILQKKSIDYLRMLNYFLKKGKTGNTFFYIAEDKEDIELHKMLVSLTKKKKKMKNLFLANKISLDEVRVFEKEIEKLKLHFKELL